MPTPGWSYAIEDKNAMTVIGDLDPGITPHAGPPVGIDAPLLNIADQPAYPSGSVVAAAWYGGRTIAVTFHLRSTTLTGLSDLRKLLHHTIESGDGRKWIWISPFYVPPFDVQELSAGARYYTVSSETTMTGPFSCDVTYRLYLPSPYLLRRQLDTTSAPTRVANSRVAIYNLYGNTDYHINTTDLVSVAAGSADGDLWCVGGTVCRRYTLTGSLVATYTLPAASTHIVYYPSISTYVCRGDTQLMAWNGSAFVSFGPVVSGGVISNMSISADGQRIIMCGSFTAPRKGYMCLNNTGGIVTGEIFPSATSLSISSAYDVDGMALYVGQVDGNNRIWVGAYNTANPPAIATLSASNADIGRSRTFASVPVIFRDISTTVNGVGGGGIIEIRHGTQIAPIGEGVVTSCRFIREDWNAGDYYISSTQNGNLIYRLRAGRGLACVASMLANAPTDAIRYNNRLVIVGATGEISRLHRFAPSVTTQSGCAIHALPPTPLAMWTDYDNAFFATDYRGAGEANTLSSEAQRFASASDWEMERRRWGGTVYQMFDARSGSAGTRSIYGTSQVM
jgi:hypothetical protein